MGDAVRKPTSDLEQGQSEIIVSPSTFQPPDSASFHCLLASVCGFLFFFFLFF